MSIFTKKLSLHTKHEIVDIFARYPRVNVLNQKVATYYLGKIPVARIVEDCEIVPENKRHWKSKFSYMMAI